MRRAALLILLAALLTAGSAAAQDPSGTPDPDPNRGRLVAIGGQTKGGWAPCVQCHGLNGRGDASGAFPRLSGLDGWYLYKSLRDYAAGLRTNPTMRQVASQLTDRQMQDVAAHYAGFDTLPYDVRRPLRTDIRQAGAAIVAVGLPNKGIPGCSSCHGPDGTGNGMIYPRIAGQYAPYLEHQLHLWKRGERNGDAMNVMERIAKSMSDEEIRAVALYLQAVDPTRVEPAPETPMPAPSAEAGPSPPYLESPGSSP